MKENVETIMNKQTLDFECSGIDEYGRFRFDNTGYGKDVSPRFVIRDLSPDAKTITITLEDLDHPKKDFTHWVIWDIPARSEISEAIPHGKIVSALGDARQGRAYGWHKYSGPKPPKNKTHRYKFTLYVLDCELGVSAGSFKKTVLKKAQGHILQIGTIVGECVFHTGK